MLYIQQQTGPPVINTKVGSLIRGLKAAVTPFGDAVTRSTWIYAAGSAAIATGQKGKYFPSNGSTVFEFANVKYVAPPFTVTAVVKATSVLSDPIASFGGAGGGNGWQFSTGSTSNGCGCITFGGVAAYNTTSTTYFTFGSWHVYTVSVVGTTASFYRDGVFIENVTVGAPVTDTFPLAICGQNSGGTWNAASSQSVAAVFVHNRGLQASEIKQIGANPWQIFKERTRSIQGTPPPITASAWLTA